MELTIEQALQKGIEAHKAGQVTEADGLYTAILNAQPKHPDANHNMGVLAVGIGKVETALPFFKTALEANPKIAQFWLSYIDALIKLERLADAKAVLDQAKSKGAKGDGFDKLETRLSEASGVRGPTQDQVQSIINFYSQGQLQQALNQVETLITKFPNSPVLLNIQGAVLNGLGKLNLSVDAYKKALAIKPDYAEAFNNMGNALQEQGKLKEAIGAYQKAIVITPDYAEAHYNIGITLKEQGKLEEAIEAYAKAIAIKPDYAEAFNNMGNALQEQGRLKEAIGAYQKALFITPDYAEAHINMGNTLQEQGRLEGAIKAYQKAIAIKPSNAEAQYNMGNAFKEQGKLEEAIMAYAKAIAIKTDYTEAYKNMGNALRGHRFTKDNQQIEDAIISILEHKTVVRPRNVSHAALSLIKCQPKLKDLFSSEKSIVTADTFEEIKEHIARTPLLLKLMSVCPLPDLDFERLLRELRSFVVRNIDDIIVDTRLLKVQSALALQCFTNEYVYDFNEIDAEALHKLEEVVSNTLADGSQPKPHIVLCLASFTALHQYEWSTRLQSNYDIKDVIKRQITEPNKEQALKSNIRVLGEINDTVSLNVREQYEENPYPRWVNLGLHLQPASLSEARNEINLRLSNEDILSESTPDVLIAGCGTGQHSIGTASRFQNSKVLAIDLSLSSLAYAKRKTQELGIRNIEYMQADILQLQSLGRQFDIIESAGVLHHMNDPIGGWEVLVDCLRPGGLMKIGLYSELARKPVVDYRTRIAEAALDPTEDNIRSLRATITAAEDESSTLIRSWQDYFSMSELRDLLFHVQEHRFTIPQIKDCLRNLGLEFCGFEAKNIVAAFKISNPVKDAEYDLNAWSTFEHDNPRVFTGMYQFWCQKIT